MDLAPTHGIYGILPPVLALSLPLATQCSPLLPGSVALENMPAATLASMTVIAPPGTIERHYVLALALRALAPGAPLIALAHKDKGGARLACELEAFDCQVMETARKHYRICSTPCPPSLHAIEDALAAGALQQVDTTGLWSQPGVFSWNREDRGTALLLPYVAQLSGRGADLGCGIGTLSRAILTSSTVTELMLIDNDRRAIEAARRNITDPRAVFHWADLRQSIAGLSALDFVVMNPPFHDGGMEDRTLGQWFVTSAAAMMRAGGICWLTANRHLPYEALLRQLFRHVTLCEERDGYKIYKAEK